MAGVRLPYGGTSALPGQCGAVVQARPVRSVCPIIGPVFFPVEDPSTVLLAAFAVYGTALIIRPVGAVLFGRMADLRGRRAVSFPSLC